MTYKEMQALVSLLTAIAVGAWVAVGASGNPELYATAPQAAGKLLWAIGYVIAFNIVALIIATIFVSAVRREEFKDEAADERDRAIANRSMRNAYAVLSVGGLAVVIVFAASGTPVTALFVLFGAMMLAGAVESASRLVYYRLG